MADSNNPPYKTVELTEEQYEFLLEHCDNNIAFGLLNLPNLVSEDLIRELVALLEKYKSVKEALKRAT